MRTAALILSILIAASFAPGQSTQTAAAVTVSGTVSDSATSEPLRRALVTLRGNQNYFAFTDASGHFQIENVTTGRYLVTAKKPGYFDPNGASPDHVQRAIPVGSPPQPMNLKLMPAASISGRVLTSAGEPVEGAGLQFLYGVINAGRLNWNVSQGASTSDDGSYEMSGLLPGRYRIRLDQMQVPGFDLPLRSASRIPLELYPLQFYPNASEETGAQIIQLEPGSHLEADFTVSAVPAFRIGGIANSPSGYFNLSLKTATGTEIDSVNSDQPNGRWSLEVPAGSWKVVADAQSSPRYYAEQSFDVRGSDVPNINLALQRVLPVKARILDPAPESSFAQVTLSQPNRTAYSGGVSHANPADINIVPGSYRVSASVPNMNACIDTVMAGNTDLSGDDLVVSEGASPGIDISLRSDCASLTVDLDSAEQRTTSVILVPENRVLEPIRLETQSGTAQFAKLSPGQYTVYAFSSADDLEYANPEVMRNYSGQSVTLAPNEHSEIKLAVIERGSQ